MQKLLENYIFDHKYLWKIADKFLESLGISHKEAVIQEHLHAMNVTRVGEKKYDDETVVRALVTYDPRYARVNTVTAGNIIPYCPLKSVVYGKYIINFNPN